MLEKVLEKIGLTEKEAKVYLATLELAKETVQNIAKKAGVNRPTAYFILEKLMKLGLVSTVEEDHKSFFVAESPTELEGLLDKEEKDLEVKKIELKASMSELKAIFNLKQGKPIVRYFEGADGLIALENYGGDMLKKTSEILSITPIDLLESFFPSKRKDSLSQRVKLGIKARTIYTRDQGEIPKAQNKAELREGRIIPRDKFPINAIFTTFPGWGVKIFYLDPAKPYGIMLENAELANNFKLIFEVMWVGAKELNK